MGNWDELIIDDTKAGQPKKSSWDDIVVDDTKADTSEIPSVTLDEKTLEPPIEVQKYSGKDLNIISNITKDVFSTNELFRDENNKMVYFDALQKKGYTPDDIYAIKTRIFPGYSVTTTDPKPTRSDQFAFELGSVKNYNIYKGTKDLFATDPKYIEPENRQAYYNTLKEKGVDTNLMEKNIENNYLADKILKGQGAAALINPIGAVVSTAADMTRAGIDEWSKVPEVFEKEGFTSASLVAIKGAVDVALGALSITPAGIGFITVMNTASEFAPHAVEKILTPVSSITGIKPKTEGGKAALGLADLILFGVFMKKGHQAAEYTGAKGKQFIKEYKNYENKQMMLQELTKEFGELPKEQQAQYAQLWADMKMRQMQGKGGELFKAPFEPEKTKITPINDANTVLDSATELFKKEKQEFEQAKESLTQENPTVTQDAPVVTQEAVVIEPKTDAPAKLSESLAQTIVPKLQAYVNNFDKSMPVNEVAAGLSVTYRGRNGKLGRDDATGEILFTDYSNGKTEIISGGGDTTPFEKMGLKINEWYYSDKHGDYHIEGDSKGFTVYKIVNGKQRPVYEGDKINQDRRDAIIRKATGKTNVELEFDNLTNKIEQVKSDIEANKGTPLEEILNESLGKLEAQKEGLYEQVAVENSVEAMAEVGRVKLQEEIVTLETGFKNATDAGKEIIQAELEPRRAALNELAKEEVPQEKPQSFGRLKEIYDSISKDVKDAVKESEIADFRKDMTRDKMELMLKKMEALGTIKIDC